jgi:hypothetical protein
MPLEPFDIICPAVANQEQASVTVTAQTFGVPLGRHGLREYYCTELDCDCRRVLVHFFRPEHGLQSPVLAAINFGWEAPRYYRKWSRSPDLWREMAGATLEAFSEQGPDAESFLALFKNTAKQPGFVAGFKRHYALLKIMLVQGKWLPTAY